MEIRLYLHRKCLVASYFICISAILFSVNVWADDISKHDFKDGDILLQHLPSYLSSVIADVTNSQYSHCGIIVHRNSEPYVIEAIGPVLYTPVRDWINRGISGYFTQIRPKNLTSGQIRKVIAESVKFLGKPYDIQYELDDEKIYCSELVYKAFLRGCHIEIGTKSSLGSLNWKPHEKFIRHVAHGKLPLERILITPESLVKSPDVTLVYSSFPQPKDSSTGYDTAILKGTWSGEYTVKSLDKGVATLILGGQGDLRSGYIKYNNNRIEIKSFSVIPFVKKENFTARLKDNRGIEAVLNARIRDNGNKIIGNWKDNLGYTGIFSFSRKM